MPPAPPLLTRKQYIDNLRYLRPSSAQGPCPICQENFSRDDPPVKLPGCGHVFCISCVLAWFRSGGRNSNTCPLDRTVLFALPPSPSPPWMDNALEHQPWQRRRAQQYVALIQGRCIVSINGHLTQEGCRAVVLDLWFYTYHLYRCADFEELWSRSVTERLLRKPVEDSVPRGVRLPRQAWRALMSVARQMMVMVCSPLSRGCCVWGDWTD
jgi:hypothetical protein